LSDIDGSFRVTPSFNTEVDNINTRVDKLGRG